MLKLIPDTAFPDRYQVRECGELVVDVGYVYLRLSQREYWFMPNSCALSPDLLLQLSQHIHALPLPEVA